MPKKKIGIDKPTTDKVINLYSNAPTNIIGMDEATINVPADQSVTVEYGIKFDNHGNASAEVQNVTVNDNKVEEVDMPQQTPQVTIDQALKDKLFLRLKEYRDSNEEYCIIDRFNSVDFAHVFKDALYAYRTDVALCERLYLKEHCKEETRQMYVLPDAAKQLGEEFSKYVSTINWENFDEAYLAEVNAKVQDYQTRLQSPEMQAQLQDAPVLIYDSGYDQKFLAYPLKSISDEVLDQYCGIIARFIVAYFLTMRFVFTNKFSLSLASVKGGDYEDIVAIFEIR